LRRPFTYANRGKLLDGGLIHEPPAEAGPGPFPILLIIYPGEAASWEGVSAPLAARGFVVVSYFPRRLLDLEGDLDDLRLLFNLVAAGQLSTRGDRQQLALAGGSVSTVYTYLLAERIAASSGAGVVDAAVQYGGLFDLYAFRHSWESGAVLIDPGISELEYLLVAFGRPDTRPEIYLRLSPRYRIAPASLPPTLLVHAERDVIVPAEQSRLAAAGYERAGIPHRLLLYPALEHYLDISKRDPAQLDMLEQTIAFLQRWDSDR
jgi:dipeptidyl aminopeptidase/acylaminoacyl peptidase